VAFIKLRDMQLAASQKWQDQWKAHVNSKTITRKGRQTATCHRQYNGI